MVVAVVVVVVASFSHTRTFAEDLFRFFFLFVMNRSPPAFHVFFWCVDQLAHTNSLFKPGLVHTGSAS